MTCPACGSTSVYVKDTTPSTDGKVYRRRLCAECSMRFKTIETVMSDTSDGDYLEAVKNKSSVIRAYYENR